MFEEKVAQNLAYAYNESNKQAWMEALRDYMIGMRWEMRDLLIWAENFSRKTIEVADIRRFVDPTTKSNVFYQFATHLTVIAYNLFVL